MNPKRSLCGPEKMTSKQRVRRTLACQEADRVPINYSGNGDINRRMMEYLGLEGHDWEGFNRALGVDFRYVGAPYTGPRLHEDEPPMHVDPCWGWRTRWVEHDFGGYWDYCQWPLTNAGVDEIARWPMPDPDQFDYSVVAPACRANKDYAVHIGHPGLACIINTAGFLRTMGQVFVDLITDDEAGLLLIDRMLDVHYQTAKRTLKAAEGGIDFMWMGEDLGTQIGPIISMDLFRRHIKPRHQRFIDLAKQYDLPVMIHTCGSSSWAYEEYISMGMNAVDTLQPEAANMSPAYLKRTFGGRLAFHGCISTAGPVATGSVQETIDYCRDTLSTMMPGGGYCFSPTHSLQDNSPTENVVAMYETAHKYGHYN